MKKRISTILLSAAIAVWMIPAVPASAASVSGPVSRTESTKANAPSEKNEVVVIYKAGKVTTDVPKTAKEKRAAEGANRAKSFGRSMAAVGGSAKADAENTLGDQAEILGDSLDDNYSIQDTVVFDGKKDRSDTVVSVIHSDKYSTKQLVSRLEDNSDVRYAEPNYIYSAEDMNDTYYKECWQLNGENGIHAEDGWARYDEAKETAQDGDVVIAVMDTGIDNKHEELKDQMWKAPDNFSNKLKTSIYGYDFTGETKDASDDNGHGTHCAGIIAAAANNGTGISGVVGSGPKIRLMSLRVLDSDGGGDLATIVSAFRYAARAKELGVNLKAINCSLGASTTSDIFDTVIEEAGKDGILTIAAAGNESVNNDVVPSSPANSKSDYVISVAATDEDGSIASYSNYGKKKVDVAAPGTNIVSSVSYDNYTPYLYTADKLKETTQYYGEFDDSSDTGSGYQPVSGDDISGSKVTGIDTFGAAKTESELTKGSTATASLSLDKSSNAEFGPGNNKTSLKWTIKNAKEDDVFILYFPYEKLATSATNTYSNIAFRTHVDEGGTGELNAGDVIVSKDRNGAVSHKCATDEEYEGALYDVSGPYNSIWHADSSNGALFSHNDIGNLKPSGKTDSSDTASGKADGTGSSNDQVSASSARKTDEADGESADENNKSDAANDASAESQEVSASDAGSASAADRSGNTDSADKSGSSAEVSSAESAAENKSDSTEDSGKDSSSPSEAVTDDYGLGLVYTATSNGDVTIDVSELAISKVGVDTSDFGKYDTYSGTSMATPVVTGSVALIASMNPKADALELKDILLQTTNDKHENDISSGGAVDFSEYPSGTVSAKPAVERAEVDFSQKTVTLRGASFSDAPAITAVFNTKKTQKKIDPADITVQGDTITIQDKYGLIGSDVSFKVSNGSKTGQGTFYLVRGETPYTSWFETDAEQDSDEDEWDFLFEDEEETDSSLHWIPNGSKPYAYKGDGEIYTVKTGEKKHEIDALPQQLISAVEKYAKAKAKADKKSYWKLADGEAIDLSCGTATYMGGTIYEIVQADLGDRESYLLVGLDVSSAKPKWRIYGDTMSDFGSLGDVADLSGMEGSVLSSYDGRLYLMGGTVSSDSDNDAVNGSKSVISAEPSIKGTKWRREAKLPGAVFGGKAVNSNGKLYYVLGNTDDKTLNDKIYAFDGSKWVTAANMPKVLKDTETVTSLFFSYTVTQIDCAVGQDKDGILFGGASFDGVGDTFRFNTKTGEFEPLGYTLFGDISDRTVSGSSAGTRFYASYDSGDGAKTYYKSFKISNPYIKVKGSVSGKGTGYVSGIGTYVGNDRAVVNVIPDKGSYIQSVHITGAKSYKKKYSSATASAKKGMRQTFRVTKASNIEVVFGKISSKIALSKTKLTLRRGETYQLKAHTNGTKSAVRWSSSNKKYATVTSSGKVTVKRGAKSGKTVKITATAADNSKLKKSCVIRIK